MNCEQVVEQYQHALDREAAPVVPAAVHQHIAECSDCAARVADLHAIHRQLLAFPRTAEDDLPKGFHQHFMAQLAAQAPLSPAVSSGSSNWALASCIAAAAVLLFVAAMESWQLSRAPHAQLASSPVQLSPVAAKATPEQIAAAAALSDLGNFVTDAQLPTPERVYAAAAPNLADFTDSLFYATSSLAQSLTPAADK